MSSVLGKKYTIPTYKSVSNTDVLCKHFEAFTVLMMVKMFDLICDIAERKYHM